MSTTTKRLSAALAAVLFLTLGGAAIAMNHPSLSLTAFKNRGTFVGAGSYHRDGRGHHHGQGDDCDEGDRSVDLFVDGRYVASTTTGSNGAYRVQAGALSKGTHELRTYSQGHNGGGYGDYDQCDDAWSMGVKVKS